MLIDHAAGAADASAAPAKKYVRRLKEIRSFEVAFVPRGANGWDFLIIKEDAAMPSLEDGPTIEFVQELKSLNADLHTVAAACADLGVVDALDGLVARSGALMKMAQAAVAAATDKAGVPPSPLPSRTPGTAAAAATAEAPLTTQPSQQNLDEATLEEPKDMIEAEGAECSEPDLDEKDASTEEVSDTDKALPSEGKPGGHKAPPKGYPKEKGKYADPANYKYPLDTEAHVRAALSYFSKPKNRAGYGAAEVKAIWSRIVSAARKLGIKVQSSGKPGTDKCGASCEKGVHEEISVMANKEEQTEQTATATATATAPAEVNKGVEQARVMVDLNQPAPAPADKAGEAASASGSGTSLIGVSAGGASGATGATTSLPSTTAQVPPQTTGPADVIGALKSAMNELLAPVVKSITDMRAEFEAKLVEVTKSATGEAAVPSAATPGATATTPAPAAKPAEPPTGKQKVSWPSDFNENREVPQDTIND